MPKAVWNGVMLAESNQCIVVEGHHYFPPGSVQRQYLVPGDLRTSDPWKGEAHYYDVVVGTQVNKDAAWCYPLTKPEAKQLEGYFAFRSGVSIEP
jgi:uncharacterized protein (DUF427 family)